MNLILFETAELGAPLARTDPRTTHLLDVLRRHPGDTFDAGLVNGPHGKGMLVDISDNALTLSFTWGSPPTPPAPITLIIGLPRPQTARKILQEATTLGVSTLHFVHTEKSDPNYADSTLWTSGEWRRHLVTGAEQAFDTHLPDVTWNQTLAHVIVAPSPAGTARVALDNYEATGTFGAFPLENKSPPAAPPPLILAFGPERGWGAKDRAALQAGGFTLAHLGSRVLRAETAVIAATAIARSRLGLM